MYSKKDILSRYKESILMQLHKYFGKLKNIDTFENHLFIYGILVNKKFLSNPVQFEEDWCLPIYIQYRRDLLYEIINSDFVDCALLHKAHKLYHFLENNLKKE